MVRMEELTEFDRAEMRMRQRDSDVTLHRVTACCLVVAAGAVLVFAGPLPALPALGLGLAAALKWMLAVRARAAALDGHRRTVYRYVQGYPSACVKLWRGRWDTIIVSAPPDTVGTGILGPCDVSLKVVSNRDSMGYFFWPPPDLIDFLVDTGSRLHLRPWPPASAPGRNAEPAPFMIDVVAGEGHRDMVIGFIACRYPDGIMV